MANVARTEGVSTLRPGRHPAPSAEEDDVSGEDDGEGSGDEPNRSDALATAARTSRAKADDLRKEIRKPDNTPQRVRDLQSALDTERNRARELEALADRNAREPLDFLRKAATEGWDAKKILEYVNVQATKRQTDASTQAAQKSEPLEIINDLLDSDDEADIGFARFLRRRMKAGWPVTRTNLVTHRTEYDEIAAGRSNDDDEKPTPKTTVRTHVRRVPPKVAGGGGANLGGDEGAGWKPNTSTQDLLSRGFREQDTARAR